MDKAQNHRLAILTAVIVLMSMVGCSTKDAPSEYPNKPIEVIVPFAPGGGSDTFARLLKAEVESQGLLPQPLVIINAPGAGGSVGSRRVMNEAADGYTVLLLHDGILTAKRSGKTLYGPEVFEQVAGTGRTGAVVVVHEDSPHSDLRELLSAAANAPDTVTFAANLGAPSHFVGLMLEQAHGSAKFRFAQTGGGADRFSALKGQHAVATTLSLEEYLRFRSDGVRAIAFLGSERHEQIPEVASAIEQGVPVTNSVMQYWWMPKGTPKGRRERFAQALEQAVSSPKLRQQLINMKIDPIYLDGEELTAHLAETEAAMVEVDPGTESPLPNIPLALAALTMLLGGGMIATRDRVRQTEPAHQKRNDTQPNTKNANSTWSAALSCVLFVLVYALLTIALEFPLGVTTSLFVGGLGLILAKRDQLLRQAWVTSTIAGTAIALGVVFHFVFTQLFEIGL